MILESESGLQQKISILNTLKKEAIEKEEFIGKDSNLIQRVIVDAVAQELKFEIQNLEEKLRVVKAESAKKKVDVEKNRAVHGM